MIKIDSKLVQRLICIFQATYILLFLTNVSDIITNFNIYTGFALCVSINMVTVILNMFHIIKLPKDKMGIKLLLIFGYVS